MCVCVCVCVCVGGWVGGWVGLYIYIYIYNTRYLQYKIYNQFTIQDIMNLKYNKLKQYQLILLDSNNNATAKLTEIILAFSASMDCLRRTNIFLLVLLIILLLSGPSQGIGNKNQKYEIRNHQIMTNDITNLVPLTAWLKQL